jgi:hypothetical protein
LDNASNNSGFIERLGDSEQKDNTMDNSGSIEELAENIWDKRGHFRCFAHVLNLSVQAPLEYLNVQLERIRTILKKIKLSTKLTEEFKKRCVDVYKLTYLKIRLDRLQD